MFFRGEEIVATNNNTSTTLASSIVADDKHLLILNDFQRNQNLIQNSLNEQKNVLNSNSNSSPNTFLAQEESQYTINNNNKKYTNPLPNQVSQPTKRKASDSLHNSSYHKNILHHKPVSTEILSTKCVLYIYYKGELSNIVDDHFKKSFTHNASKSTATLSPLSLSSTSSSPIAKTSSKSSKRTSPTSCTTSKQNHLNEVPKTSNNHNDTWSYYNSINASNQSSLHSQMANSSLTNYSTTAYENCWNRTAVDMAATLYTNQHYHYTNSLSKLNQSSTPSSNIQYSNNQYFNDSIYNGFLTNENQSSLKASVKDEPQVATLGSSFDATNGSFLSAAAAAAAAAVINPYSFQNQQNLQNHQQDMSQYGLSSQTLSSNSNQSLSSTHHLSADNYNAVAVAAVAANQYLNASLTAAAAAVNVKNSNSSHFNHHNGYPHYFEIGKQSSQIDFKRSSNTNNSSYPHYGYDFNNSSNDSNIASNSSASSMYKETSSPNNTQSYASPIWY